MKYTRVCLATLILLVSGCKSDNGEFGISDLCIKCIERAETEAAPLGAECVPHPDIPDNELCGAFKISERFYIDCINRKNATESNIPKEWGTWKGCFQDYRCGYSCVKSYHDLYTDRCQTKAGRELTCADYGQIHKTGPLTCGDSYSERAEKYINNMTRFCGDLTVHGKHHYHNTVIALSCVCGILVVAIVCVIVTCWLINRRKERKIDAPPSVKLSHENSQPKDNTTEKKNDVGYREETEVPRAQPEYIDVQS